MANTQPKWKKRSAAVSVAAAVAAIMTSPQAVWAQSADAALEGYGAPNTARAGLYRCTRGPL